MEPSPVEFFFCGELPGPSPRARFASNFLTYSKTAGEITVEIISFHLEQITCKRNFLEGRTRKASHSMIRVLWSFKGAGNDCPVHWVNNADEASLFAKELKICETFTSKDKITTSYQTNISPRALYQMSQTSMKFEKLLSSQVFKNGNCNPF